MIDSFAITIATGTASGLFLGLALGCSYMFDVAAQQKAHERCRSFVADLTIARTKMRSPK